MEVSFTLSWASSESKVSVWAKRVRVNDLSWGDEVLRTITQGDRESTHLVGEGDEHKLASRPDMEVVRLD